MRNSSDQSSHDSFDDCDAELMGIDEQFSARHQAQTIEESIKDSIIKIQHLLKETTASNSEQALELKAIRTEFREISARYSYLFKKPTQKPRPELVRPASPHVMQF